LSAADLEFGKAVGDAEASSSQQLGENESNRAASLRALGPERRLPEL
jgi:hypothetical protein